MKPTARTNDLVIQEIKSEILVYDNKTNKVACLNETLASVWMFCNGRNSIEKISKLMSDKFKSNVSQDLIWLSIEKLNINNLIENTDHTNEFSNYFPSVSRREIIRKAGLASIIALPAISMLVAPQAIDAQSGACLTTQATCTANPQCCSGVCNGPFGCCIQGFGPATQTPCTTNNDCCSQSCDTTNGQCIFVL